jgi:hypothetical protein
MLNVYAQYFYQQRFHTEILYGKSKSAGTLPQIQPLPRFFLEK